MQKWFAVQSALMIVLMVGGCSDNTPQQSEGDTEQVAPITNREFHQLRLDRMAGLITILEKYANGQISPDSVVVRINQHNERFRDSVLQEEQYVEDLHDAALAGQATAEELDPPEDMADEANNQMKTFIEVLRRLDAEDKFTAEIDAAIHRGEPQQSWSN